MLRILRREGPLKSAEDRCLKDHPRHFTVPSDAMQHLCYEVIHFRRILVESPEEDCQGFHYSRVGESAKSIIYYIEVFYSFHKFFLNKIIIYLCTKSINLKLTSWRICRCLSSSSSSSSDSSSFPAQIYKRQIHNNI